MKADDQVLQIFREECGERLDRIQENLLAAESGPAEGAIIDALFRDAHSIKGNAGMVGFDAVRVIAHAMEDVLGAARDEGLLEPELVDPLLEAADAMRRAIAGERGTAGDVVERLAALSAAPDGTLPAGPADRDGAPALDNGGGTVDLAAPVVGPSTTERRSMRVATVKVDRLLDVVGETVLHHRRLEHLMDSEAGGENVEEEFGRGQNLLDELQDAVIQMRTLPLSSITGPFPRAVRDVAAAQGKEVELSITGADTQLDRVILDGVSETITHLLRNSISHGIEPPDAREAAGKPRRGRLELRAEQRGGMVAIGVSDDGRGVSADLLERAHEQGSLTDVLAQPGFSTASGVTDLAGRGVGLDAVKTHVESLGGSLEVVSQTGTGMRAVMLLPLTLALLRVLLVRRGGQRFALPLGAVQEALVINGESSLGGSPAVQLQGRAVPLNDLAELIGSAAPDLPERPPAVVVTSSQHRAAVMCDRLDGEEEVVIKGLGLLAGVAGYLGAAILEDGRIALVLDPAYIVRRRGRGRISVEAAARGAAPSRVLVVDDQFTVRELQRSILETAGYDVVTAADGRQALDQLEGDAEITAVVTDIQMPELDGFGLLERIRAHERLASLPVVVVTSMGDEAQRLRGAELGADAYIVKEDFDQQALLETIAHLVGT
jgi:two-component system chemotaxis sensor kinase CheA